jgi:hypothetical protein
MIPVLPWIVLGAWQIAIPVDGLNDQNAAAFRERIVEYFKSRTDDAGQPVAVQVTTRNTLATITVDCPVASVAMSDLNKALKDSPFSLKLDKGDGGHWMLQGRAAFCWRSGAALSEEQVDKLRTLLKGIGLGTASIDVVSTSRKCHYHNTLRIVLGPDQSVPAFKIVEILEQEGHRNPDLIWEKGDRTRCGAYRNGSERD